MKAIVVDDNERARITLKSDLKDYCNQIEVIGEAEGVVSAFEVIQNLKPDLVFLDIKMRDGTGFDLLEKFKLVGGVSFTVIFTTAYDEYAIKAFKYAAAAYLLKPIAADELVEAVGRIHKKEVGTSLQMQLDVLKQYIGNGSSQKIALPEADRIHLVEVNDIIHCESDKNYTTFFLVQNKKITVSRTLKEYENLLSKKDFIRVHHSHLVNLQHIKELVKLNGPYLKMSDG
jgi:two-component system LytT family response regulator